MPQDKQDAYETLYYVLVNMAKLFAPVAPIISEKIYRTLTRKYSVHLTSWPEIPASFKDDKLLNEVKLVRNIIYIARSIRNKNNVKNRIPLNMLRIALSDSNDNEVIKEFSEIIKEELNVKNIEILNDVESIAKVKYAPNFNEIKNRYKAETPQIISAIREGKFKFENDNIVNLEINGETKSYDAVIILVTYLAKEGEHVASQDGAVVSLDLNITDELKEEGFARDIVRSIQDSRKKMDCDITDIIQIDINGDVPQKWLDYIYHETLSRPSKFDDETLSFEVSYDEGKSVKVRLRK